jgi:hypothetical protein
MAADSLSSSWKTVTRQSRPEQQQVFLTAPSSHFLLPILDVVFKCSMWHRPKRSTSSRSASSHVAEAGIVSFEKDGTKTETTFSAYPIGKEQYILALQMVFKRFQRLILCHNRNNSRHISLEPYCLKAPKRETRSTRRRVVSAFQFNSSPRQFHPPPSQSATPISVTSRALLIAAIVVWKSP